MILTCPNAETLSQLLNNTFPPEELESLRGHLLDCPDCRSKLDQLTDDPSLRPTSQSMNSALVSATLLVRLRGIPDREVATADYRQSSFSFGPPKNPAHIGTLNEYDVIGLRGQGGMAFVFEGLDTKLKRRVAIKMLKPERLTESNRTRFLREAQAAAGLQHDHLLPVFGTGLAPDGSPFLVMPFLEKSSLRELIATGKGLAPRQGAEIAMQIADGLSAAHAANLVHRDVKPANILIDPLDGRAKLTDFGLVRELDRGVPGSTEAGTLLGTPEYMAPEQLKHPEAADGRCDVYGLGITLYEMLTGQTPFRGQPLMIAQQIFELEPIPPRQLNNLIPRDLETICLKAICKEPARRYATAAQLRDDLRRWLDNQPILARPTGTLERLMKAARRRPALASLASALLLSLIVGCAAVSWLWNRAEANADSARNNEQLERRQRERALEHLAVAKEAVDKFYTNIYEKGLLNNPNLVTQKKELIVDALRFYQRMLDLELEDPNLIQAAAETAARMGLLTRDMDELSAAIPYFKRSVELARDAVAADPNNINRQLLLARNVNHFGVTLKQMGSLLEAEECGRECAAIYSELVQAFPDEAKHRRDLTAMQVNLANLALQRGDRAAAKAGFQGALEQFQHVAALMDNHFVAQLDLARIEYNLYFVADSAAEAIGWLEKSCNRRRDLLSKEPDHQLARRDFVLSCDALARQYAPIPEKRVLALDIISEGIREARIALKTDPNHLEFQSLLTTSLQTAGVLAHELNRHEDAERYFEETAPLMLRLLEKDRARHRLTVARMLAERVEIRLAQKRSAEAAKDRQLAIQLIDEYLPTLSKKDYLREEAEATRRKLGEIK